MLKTVIAEVETYEHGTLFSVTNKKEYRLTNLADYPITNKHVNEMLKELGKQMLPLMKKYAINRTMVTVYGYNYNQSIANIERYTFEQMDGKLYVIERPFNGSFGFEANHETGFENIKDARKLLLGLVKRNIIENMEIHAEKDNPFTNIH